jgi:hypothetical protein
MKKTYKEAVQFVKEIDKNKSVSERIGEYKKYCSLYGVNERDAQNLLAFYQHKIDLVYCGLPIE